MPKYGKKKLRNFKKKAISKDLVNRTLGVLHFSQKEWSGEAILDTHAGAEKPNAGRIQHSNGDSRTALV